MHNQVASIAFLLILSILTGCSSARKNDVGARVPASEEGNRNIIDGVDVSALLGVYVLTENRKGNHWWNSCPTELNVGLVGNGIVATGIPNGSRFININRGTEKQISDGRIESSTRTDVTLKETITGKVRLAFELEYKDRFASGTETTSLTFAPDGSQLEVSHKDMHSMRWYQYETGAKKRSDYKKPNYDRDCLYRKQ